MICIGHRGAMGHLAENTIESFDQAIKFGVHAIELDVISVQGEAIVFHDFDLKRLCGVESRIAEQSLDEIANLRVLEKYKIPTLTEVMNFVDSRVALNIELKSENSAASVARVLDRLKWNTDLILVSSFNHRELIKFKSLKPNIRIGALQVSLPIDNAEFAKRMNAYSVHPSLEFVDRKFVDDAHNKGLKVFVFTVNDSNDFIEMKNIEVDGVFTNYPDRFFSTLGGLANENQFKFQP